MFFSEEWSESWWARRQDGKDTKKKVLDNYFWKRSVEFVKITEPLFKVLRMVNGEKLAMGYIYEAMDQAKEQIRATYKDRLAKYGRIWEIIDNKWNNQLHRPIHAVGYFLNRKYHYKNWLGDLHDGEVRAGLIDCLECMFLPMQTSWKYIDNLLFSLWQVVTLEKTWQRWQEMWINQVVSTIGLFLSAYTRRRETVWKKKWLNDLVFVQYNHRLRRNQMMNKTPDLDPIVLDDIDPTLKWVEAENPVFEANFDIDMALAGDETDFVAASETRSVATSRKD
eukprot:PITA_25021